MGSPPGPGGLLHPRPDAVGRLVLDVPGRILEVGRVDVLVLNGVIVGRLTGGHHFFCGSSGSGSGSGGDGGHTTCSAPQKSWFSGRRFSSCISCVM